MTAFNYSNMDPSRREHFVYRAFDADGRLLYVGCTIRPTKRFNEHKGQSRWFPFAVKFTMQGPYNYQTGRRIEKEAIYGEHPLWNHNEPRRFRAQALRTRVYNRWFYFYYNTAIHWHQASDLTSARVEMVIPQAWVADGEPVSEITLARVARAEREDAELFSARTREAHA